MEKRYETKIPSIINRKVIKEEIIFRGEKIIRERIVKEFKIPKGIYLTSLNYDTGQKSSLGNKNTIVEALKIRDINNFDNNKLISVGSYDKLVKYRQFY